MPRDTDLKWFYENRAKLAAEFQGRWIVVRDARVVKAFPTEEEAIEFAFSAFDFEDASVFEAVAEDRVIYLG